MTQKEFNEQVEYAQKEALIERIANYEHEERVRRILEHLKDNEIEAMELGMKAMLEELQAVREQVYDEIVLAYDKQLKQNK